VYRKTLLLRLLLVCPHHAAPPLKLIEPQYGIGEPN